MDKHAWNERIHSRVAQGYRDSGAWLGKTTADYALQRVLDTPEHIAVVEGENRLSYAQLWAEAQRVTAGLRDLGLQPGDVISFQLPNWWESVVVNLAASLGGWSVNPIVPIYRDAEVGFILQDCQAKVIFVPETFRSTNYVEMLQRIAANGAAGPLIVTVRGGNTGATLRYEMLGRERPLPDQARAAPDDLKLVMYTSGTTGQPKGVLHSHNTLLAELRAATQFWRVVSEDVFFVPSPVTHITGYCYALELVFFAGIKVVLMDRWDADQALGLIQSEAVTLTLSATPFLAELTSAVEASGTRPPSLRMFATGGAPVPPELVLRASRALPGCLICRIYGSSEAPTVTLGINDEADQERAAVTDGKVFNNEVRMVDPVTGEQVALGQEGEILVRGPEGMICYARQAETLDAYDADGFFRTGDLGTLSADGFITVTGRKKDLIIRGGENLSPKEIEDLLHEHEDVLEAAVVAMPHTRMGETPCAYVVLKRGGQMSLAQMCAYLDAKRLARQKFPERLVVVDALPKTASGKILKHVLRDQARAGILSSGELA